MRVLVFGAGGQVGAELVKICDARGDEVVGVTHSQVDIGEPAAVAAAIEGSRPEVVFNAAAYTKVDKAEEEPAVAERINADAPGYVATACAAHGIRMVHYSTDYVFDGTATAPIPEDAPTNPLGTYGRTKLEGERRVLAGGAPGYLVRTAWVYGHDGPNFVKTVLRVVGERGAMRVVNDQRGSPTWARDLAQASRHLVDAGSPGTYHLTNSGDCTWFDLAAAIVELAGLDAKIEPIPTSEYPTPAKRPRYSVLDNRRWRELGEAPLRPWRAALEEFLDELLPARGGKN